MSYHVGIDVGGTFTDCVAISPDGQVRHAKALSSRGDPTGGIMNGLTSLAGEVGVDLNGLLGQVGRFCHGTTIGTNLVVERKGARVGLICTRGHADAILMMRGTGGAAGKAIEDIYKVHEFRTPAPIVPRTAILEIDERVDRNGDVVVALDEAVLRKRLSAWLQAHSFEAVAVCLLWSFRNPQHEVAVARILRELAPDLFVSASCEVAPRMGEYERTVATVINGYVGPASTNYLNTLRGRLASEGLVPPVLVMQSNGGVVAAEQARSRPFTIIDSGPTGGLAGAAALAKATGRTNVIATDMGGTSFDVGLVIGGEPIVAGERTIAQYTYQLPHLDVRSIACGGGSIAKVDRLTRSLRVGPESAGSEPGPACYGRGGAQATVTDADVVLGLLRPDSFLGGRMRLDADASRRVIGTLGAELGLSVEETAAGIININNSNAALLVRQRTIEQGLDPRDFAIYAFGGAGPVHAFGFAAELGIKEVVIPLGNGASTFSAYGIASADSVRYVEAECTLRAPFDAGALAAAVEGVEAEARLAVEREGGVVTDVERVLLMRYVGQFLQSMPVRLRDGALDEAAAAEALADFERDYERLFGEGARVVFQTIEAFAIRLKITGDKGFRTAVRAGEASPRVASDGDPLQHEVFWPNLGRRVATRIVDGSSLAPGDSLEGPALVELPHTTVAVPPGQRLTADPYGSLVLSL